MKFFLLAILLIISLNSRAQKTLIDSLKRRLGSEQQDTLRVGLLYELGNSYKYTKPDTALLFGQQGMLLARKLKFQAGQAKCLNLIGNVIAETGNYPKALEIQLQALKIGEEIKDRKQIAYTYLAIGNIYIYQKDEKQALTYYLKCKRIAMAMHDEKLLVKCLGNIGDSYEKANELDSARHYTLQAYEMSLHMKNRATRVFALCNLGNIYARMDQPEIAMAYYRQGMPDMMALSDNESLTETTLGMATLFKKAGKKDSALFYAYRSLAIARKNGFTRYLLNASSFMALIYKSERNVDSAYAYEEMTIAAKDSLFSQQKNKEMQNLGYTEISRQQELAAGKEAEEESRKKNIQMAGIGAFIPLFFGILLLYSKKKTQPRVIEFLGLLGLLLLFEFIALFIHPYIAAFTHDTPLFMLMILVATAALLVPLHHRLEGLLKARITGIARHRTDAGEQIMHH